MLRKLEALLESPLQLSRARAAVNYAPTLDYIPGTTVRGFLGSLYFSDENFAGMAERRLNQTGLQLNDYLDWLFSSGEVRFPNLYPSPTRFSNAVPLSARQCKNFPGFLADPIDDYAPHGIMDVLLLGQAVEECMQGIGGASCKGSLEPPSGFYHSSTGGRSGSQSVQSEKREITRTAIINSTRSTRAGFLYSLEALEESGKKSNSYRGQLYLTEPANADERIRRFREVFLDDFARVSEVSLGGSRSRGLGAVRLQLSEQESPPVFAPLKDRFENLQSEWRRLHSSEETVFTLTLSSDTILRDELWRYQSCLEMNLLEREIPHAPTGALIRHFTATRMVSGWNVAHRLPKEDQIGIVKGAAFLYTTDAPDNDVIDWLRRAEDQGIGERREEGFGVVVACHPFHWEAE